jgi:hypothetical protein
MSSTDLNSLLELIESQIDIEQCNKIDQRYHKALSCEEIDRPPLVIQPEFGSKWQMPKPWDKFQLYTYRQAFDDPAAMLQNMLLSRVVPWLIMKDDSPLAIRNDHGTIQIASLLGGQWHFHHDNYPWVSSLGSTDAIKDIVGRDSEIDFAAGVLPQSTKTLKFYQEQISKYPKCKQVIQISLPDLQGPIDTADILWGSKIFLAILTEPQLVTALMTKIVDTMIKVANYYRQFTSDRLEPFANTQHGYNIPGRLMIRNDSAIMVSPDTYREMILPQDARLLKEAGTGTIHFCGDGDHLIEPMLEIPDVRGIDLGQPELMDTRKLFEMCSSKRVAVTHINPSREDLVSGQAVQNYPTGAVFIYYTVNFEDAIEVVNLYNNSTN